MRRLVVTAVVLFHFVLASSLLFGTSCGSGTLAQLINTTCTIGNVSFTFNNFNGYYGYTDANNNYVSVPLDPSTILFQSVVSGNAQGITLTPAWVENPSASQLFLSSHNANFYYTVTAVNGVGIIGQSDRIVGSIGNATDTGSIGSGDQQNYYVAPWCCTFSAYTSVNYTNNLGYYNEPYLAVYYSDFGVGPQYASDPTNPGWHSLDAFAYTTQIASLQSETFLYFTQGTTPEPSTVLLTFGGLATALVKIRRKLSSFS